VNSVLTLQSTYKNLTGTGFGLNVVYQRQYWKMDLYYVYFCGKAVLSDCQMSVKITFLQ